MGNLAELAFRRHYGDVYRFVRRRSSSWADAGDVTAEVFADAAKALDRFEPGATPVLAWPVAAAVALLLVAPWQGRGPSVVDRALAVVGSGPVIHAVLEQPSPAVTVNLATGEEQALVSRVELWYSEQPRELRRRVTVAGELASDFLSTHGFMSLPDPALTEFATGYRAALAEGRAHVVGDVEVDGRRAKRIEFAPDLGGGVETVTVDAETFVPLTVYMTIRGGFRTPVQRVVTIESLPYDASDFETHNSSTPRRFAVGIDAPTKAQVLAAASALHPSR